MKEKRKLALQYARFLNWAIVFREMAKNETSESWRKSLRSGMRTNAMNARYYLEQI